MTSVHPAFLSGTPQLPAEVQDEASPEFQLNAKKEHAFVDAYHSLTLQQIENQRIATLPKDARFLRIDVTDRMQPASFRHTSTILVPYGPTSQVNNPDEATSFYVAFGRSTNSQPGLFGPFPL